MKQQGIHLRALTVGITVLDVDTKTGEQESQGPLQPSEHPTEGFANIPSSIVMYSLPLALMGGHYNHLSESENTGNCGG